MAQAPRPPSRPLPPSPFAGRWETHFERRASARRRRRLACEIHAAGRRHAGLVVDLSAGGLFVQTQACLVPGAAVRLRVRGERGEIPLEAAVVRLRSVPLRLASVARGGLGLRLVGGGGDGWKALTAPRE